jgi:hypothetical protein
MGRKILGCTVKLVSEKKTVYKSGFNHHEYWTTHAYMIYGLLTLLHGMIWHPPSGLSNIPRGCAPQSCEAVAEVAGLCPVRKFDGEPCHFAALVFCSKIWNHPGGGRGGVPF